MPPLSASSEEPFVELLEAHGAYLAAVKAAGVRSHGPGGLLEAVRAALGDDTWALVHRLDRGTSGVLLLAHGTDALRVAHRAWSAQVSKTYLALVEGAAPQALRGTIDAPILEHRTARPDRLERALRAAYGPSRAGHLLGGRRVGAIPPVPSPGTSAIHPAGRPAQTRYEVVATGTVNGRRVCLVRLEPHEGRMHQLRLHLGTLGLRVLGERLYGEAWSPFGAEGAGRLALHATTLEWTSPPDSAVGAWRWTAPPPPTWAPLIDTLGPRSPTPLAS